MEGKNIIQIGNESVTSGRGELDESDLSTCVFEGYGRASKGQDIPFNPPFFMPVADHTNAVDRRKAIHGNLLLL